MADLTCGAGGSTAQEVLTDINANTDAIADLSPRLTTAEADIDALEVQDTTNQANITELQAQNYFQYDAQQNILDVPETYTQLCSLDIADLKAGTYMVSVSMTYTFSSTSTSAFLRMTVNGTPEIFEREPKDNTDRIPIAYTFPYVHGADGQFTLLTESRKENINGTLDVLFANAMLDRKL